MTENLILHPGESILDGNLTNVRGVLVVKTPWHLIEERKPLVLRECLTNYFTWVKIKVFSSSE